MSEITLNKHQEMFLAQLRNKQSFEIPNVKHFMEQAEFTDLSLMQVIRQFKGKPVITQHHDEQITSMIINFNSETVRVKLGDIEVTTSKIDLMLSEAYNDAYIFIGEDMTKDNHIIVRDAEQKDKSIYLGDLIKDFLVIE